MVWDQPWTYVLRPPCSVQALQACPSEVLLTSCQKCSAAVPSFSPSLSWSFLPSLTYHACLELAFTPTGHGAEAAGSEHGPRAVENKAGRCWSTRETAVFPAPKLLWPNLWAPNLTDLSLEDLVKPIPHRGTSLMSPASRLTRPHCFWLSMHALACS